MSNLKERIDALTPQQRRLLEARLKQKKAAAPVSAVIQPRKSDGPGPLSLDQERLWFLTQLEPLSYAYHLSNSYQLDGDIDVRALKRTVNEIVRRHETLRTWFPAADGVPTQYIAPELDLQVPVVDLRALDESASAAALLFFTTSFTREPFSIENGPLMRVGLVRVGEARSVVFFSLHHIIMDRWSFSILWRELTTLYAAFASGRPSPLPELTLQFADYSAWQRERLSEQLLQQHLDFWRRTLGGGEFVLEVPTDRPRPPMQTFGGTRLYWAPNRELWSRVKELCRTEGVTMFMTILTAFDILLYRYTGQTDINVGTPFANRDQADTAGMIGYLLNMIVVRAKLDGNPTFRELLRQVREASLDAFQHGEVPFGMVVDALRPHRDLSRNPLFQVAYVHVDADDSLDTKPEVAIKGIQVDAGASIFDLTLGLRNNPSNPTLLFEYNTDLYDRSTIKRLSEHFERLLHAIVENPEARVSELSLLSDGERSWLREIGTGPVSECETGDLVHRLFEQQAARTPEATAIVGREFSRMNTDRSVFIRENSRELSYGELNRRANRLAHYLRRQGVGVESRVGVLLERNVDLPVALLAVLKTGAAYVPLDPAYPEERLRFLLADAAAQVLITSGPVSAEAHVVRLDELDLSDESEANPEVTIDSQNLSHVIYTSGSTGQPKGVMVTHGSTCELLRWARAEFSDEEFSSVLFSTSVCFDLSVFELFAPLAWGGRVVVVANALEAPVVDVQLINTVPTAMTELLRMGREVAGLTVNLAGEALPERLVQQLHERGVRRVCNLYGPTEDTTYSTWTEVGPGERVTLGRALQNTRTYVLDQWQQPVPVGVVGELYLGGAGLARGYHNRGALTAERFVPDPFSAHGGERLYRTGDLVKYLGDGRLEYLGRRDQQVKLRGYRIELGEVETVLGQHPQVWETVVVVRSGEASSQLVAYVVGEAELNREELRSYVRERLPEYMVPQQFVQLDQLPQTPNGKVDRKALPAPETRRREPGEQTAARSWAEQVLSEVWQEVLRVEGVGVDENFFDLGGDSILSIQAVSRAARRGLRMTPQQVFQHQTIAALAAVVDEVGPLPQSQLASVKPVAHDGAATPADFPLARLSQGQLDRLTQSRSTRRAKASDA